MKKKRLLFWHGILTDKDLGDYKEEIGQLQRGEYKSLLLKKHKTTGVWTIRTNDKARLIFKSQKYKDKNLLVLVEILKSHKYDTVNYEKEIDYSQSRFINLMNPDNQEIKEEDFEVVDTLDLAEFETDDDEDEQIKEPFVEYFNGQFIVLNSWQKKVFGANLPLIVGGAPGAGKTCVAMSIIIQMVEAGLEPDDVILYVALEEPLVDSMREEFFRTPASLNVAPNQVKFLTYSDLIKNLIKEADDNVKLEDIGELECKKWIENHIKVSRTLGKNQSLSRDFWNKSHLFYEEFRIIAACSKEQYLKQDDKPKSANEVGENQSCFCDKAERLWLYEAYQSFKSGLDAANLANKEKILCHLPFYKIEHKAKYKKILADEFGDLSLQQAFNLMQLAKDMQICFFGDDNQITLSTQSTVTLLEAAMPRLKNVPRYIELPFSYRSSEAVLILINKIKILNDSLANGKSLKKGYTEIELSETQRENPGKVSWLTQDEFQKMPKPVPSPNWAVITLPQYVEQARKKYGTAMVFTVNEIKGLEFDEIYLDDFFDQSAFSEINKEVASRNPANSVKKNLAKKGAGTNKFRNILNQLFTAASRARYKVHVIQKSSKNLTAIKDYLMSEKAIESENTCQQQPVLPKKTAPEPQPLSEVEQRAAWYKKADNLIRKGLIRHAKNIFIDHLKDPNFNEYLKKYQSTGNSQKQASRAVQTKSIALSPNEIEKKMEEYVDSIFHKFSPNNLELIFKHKDVLRYLFEFNCGELDCLFSRIVTSPAHQKIFINFLQNMPDLAKKISGKYLIEEIKTGKNQGVAPLLFMFQSEEASELLDILLQINPEMYAELNFTFLANITEKNKPYCDWVALLNLKKPKEIIRNIVKKSPGFLKGFPLDFLMQQSKTTLPLIYELAKNEEDIELIITFLQENEQYIPDIMKIFYKPVNMTNNRLGHSLFYFFGKSNKGCNFYLKLLEKNQACVETLDPKLLLESPGQKITAVIISLASHVQGICVLKKLFEKNHNLISSLTQEHLFNPISEKDGHGITTFDLLCDQLEGSSVILIIIEAKPEFLKHIDYSLLMEMRHIRILGGFLMSVAGRRILDLVFSQNKALLRQFTVGDLCTEIGRMSDNKPLNLLSLFHDTPKGIRLLNMIYNENPVLKDAIASEINLLKEEDQSINIEIPFVVKPEISEPIKVNENFRKLVKEHNNHNPIKQLHSIEKVEIISQEKLNALFKNPKKLFSDNFKTYPCFISYICDDMDEYSLRLNTVIEFLEKNSRKVHLLTAKILCKPLKEGKNKCVIPLSFFLNTSMGLILLDKILLVNKSLLKQLTLPKRRYINELAIYNYPLHNMLMYDTGRNLLSQWCISSAGKVLSDISYQALMDKSSGHSLLYLLTAKEVDRTIFMEIIRKNNDIVHHITINDLLGDEKTPQKIPLFRLSDGVDGCNILFEIFQQKKSLYQELTIEILMIPLDDEKSGSKGLNLLRCFLFYKLEFLLHLGKNNTKLLKEIMTELLNVSSFKYVNGFQRLLNNTITGHALLLVMLDANPKLPSQLLHYYGAINRKSGFLALMCSKEKGMQLFLKFLQTDADFGSALDFEHWETIYEGFPIVTRLWTDDCGQNIWELWSASKCNSIQNSEEKQLHRAKALITLFKGLPTMAISLFEYRYYEYHNIIDFFISRKELTDLFVDYITEHQNYKNALSGRYLSNPFPSGLYEGLAPLQFLMGSPNGVAILNAFLKKNPDWYCDLMFSHLKLHGPDFDTRLSYPLHKMIENPTGQTVFAGIVRMNPSAVCDMSAEMLLGEVQEHVPLLIAISVIDGFKNILLDIILANYELFKNNRAFFLTKEWIFPEFNEPQSLFCYWSIFHHTALLIYVGENQDAINEITSDVLSNPLSTADDVTSCFAALSGSADGIQVICHIFNAQPSIEEYFAKKGLLEEMSEGNGFDTFYNLLKDPENGALIFENFTRINPQFPSRLFKCCEAFCQKKMTEYNLLAILLHLKRLATLKCFIEYDNGFTTLITRQHLEAGCIDGVTILEKLRAINDSMINDWLQKFDLSNEIKSRAIPTTLLPYSNGNLFALPVYSSDDDEDKTPRMEW